MLPSASQLSTTTNHGITASTFTSSQPRANTTRENGFISPSSIKHSASVPNLGSGSFSSQAVPIVKREGSSTSSNQSYTSTSDVYAANKSMLEQIQAILGMDEDKYSAFKSISLESHHVLELARVCPDAQKQKELIDAYNLTLLNKTLQENAGTSDGRKGKGKISTELKSRLIVHYLITFWTQ